MPVTQRRGDLTLEQQICHPDYDQPGNHHQNSMPAGAHEKLHPRHPYLLPVTKVHAYCNHVKTQEPDQQNLCGINYFVHLLPRRDCARHLAMTCVIKWLDAAATVVRTRCCHYAALILPACMTTRPATFSCVHIDSLFVRLRPLFKRPETDIFHTRRLLGIRWYNTRLLKSKSPFTCSPASC